MIKKSKEELQAYLKVTEDMLQKEQGIKNRILSSGEIYPGELKLVEDNIKNFNEMINLLKKGADKNTPLI